VRLVCWLDRLMSESDGSCKRSLHPGITDSCNVRLKNRICIFADPKDRVANVAGGRYKKPGVPSVSNGPQGRLAHPPLQIQQIGRAAPGVTANRNIRNSHSRIFRSRQSSELRAAFMCPPIVWDRLRDRTQQWGSSA
jgi:hypothetical protein